MVCFSGVVMSMVRHVLQLELSARCAPCRGLDAAGPCGLLLEPTSEERTSIQNRMHITTSNTSHEGHSPLYNYYNSCMPLPSGKRISMPDWALSQKRLSADATIQNRRHSEQVTTAEDKHVTAWEIKREANRRAGLLQP